MFHTSHVQAFFLQDVAEFFCATSERWHSWISLLSFDCYQGSHYRAREEPQSCAVRGCASSFVVRRDQNTELWHSKKFTVPHYPFFICIHHSVLTGTRNRIRSVTRVSLSAPIYSNTENEMGT